MIDIAKLVLDVLFPPKCPFCGRLLDEGRVFCGECVAKVRRVPNDYPENTDENLDGVCSALFYEGGVRRAILGFKFGGRTSVAKPLGMLMAEAVRRRWEYIPDVVAPVPVGLRSGRRRGFNQAELLARQVARSLGVPMDARLVKRVAGSAVQSALDARRRRENLQGVFSAAPSAAGRSVLLVDDITTTGATLRGCAAALKAAGAVRVMAVTAAVTEKTLRQADGEDTVRRA